MANRSATYEDYNAHSREILMKIDIYFDGASNPPLTVAKADYLISSNLLEESGAEDANPLGAISSNELTFSLLNQQGLFNPANTESIYSSRIKKGVLVKPYFRIVHPDIDTWDPMGEFYVADWITTPSGIQADVIAYDDIQSIFSKESPNVLVEQQQSFYTLFDRVFTALETTAVIDPTLNQILSYAYITGKPSEFLQEMVHGALAYCNCDKLGTIQVKALQNSNTPVTTMTDNNQIVDMSITQSIVKTYDGVELTYFLPQEAEQTELISLKAFSTPTGTVEHEVMLFNKTPVLSVSGFKTISDDNMVKILSYTHSSEAIKLKTDNTGEAKPCDYTVKGIPIDNVEAKLSDNTGSLLKVSNRYIQNNTRAQEYKEVLNRFVTNPIPIVTLTIRGNPLLHIGDKIIINSEKYSLVFTGIILRAQYQYLGALSCELTLLNALILGGS